jgi:hypothetical protein
MAHYRMYLLDERNKIVSGLDLICGDDEEAIAHADIHAEGRPFEVWQSTRRVFPDLPKPQRVDAAINPQVRPPSLQRFLEELLLAC